ncbi:hypothetical protein VSDG_02477 [Cytospora chrysosperma]|uniref:Uncharacterized protein n=1 Tax=Cytospora chrysosperma TaxID=252740 RepID=A0A423WFX5_CYTCH|nr:hypothetical protein VSDG_02477 [Valsa sordida]
MSTASLTGSPTELWSASVQTSTHSSVQTGIGVDPPRPAKDGYEWVWFPEGYWAERPVARRDSSKGLNSVPAGPVGKLFKWAGIPSKSSMELLQAEQRDMSPRTVEPPFGSPKNLGRSGPATNIPQSPYFSEQAHVQSLQHPTSQSIPYRGDPDTWKSPSSPRRLDSIRAPIAAFISPGEKKTPQLLHLKHAWRAFHKSKEVEEPTQVSETKPQNGATLDTPSYFTQTAVRDQLTDETEEGEDRAKTAPKGLCKWLKKTSWNRKGVQTSSQTDMAGKSTFRNPYKRIDYASSVDPVGGLDRFQCQVLPYRILPV